MAYRYTDTCKWNDNWYSNLRPIEKLVFNYLCDNCDCAGFLEVNTKKWGSDIGYSQKEIEGALKGLARGFIYSMSTEYIYLRTFLKHQKNLPLNPEKNMAHRGIIKRFEYYLERFDILDVNEFIEGALKGLARGYGIGNGIGNDKESSNKEEKQIKSITWKTSFEIYQSDLKKSYFEILTPKYLEERKKYHPGLNIKLSIDKSIKDFWNTEAGWKNKKTTKTNEIDWKSTFNNALSLKCNQVWDKKETGQSYTANIKDIVNEAMKG